MENMENIEESIEKTKQLYSEMSKEWLTGITDTERQQVDEQKAIFKARLLNAEDVTNAVKLLIRCYKDYAEVIINNNVTDAKSKLESQTYKDGEIVNFYDPASNEYKRIEEQTHKKYWEDISKENRKYFEDVLKTVDINEEIKKEEYKKLIGFVTQFTETNIDGQQKNKKEINHLNKKYKAVLDRIDPAFTVFMHLYLSETGETVGYLMQTGICCMLARELKRAPSREEIDHFFMNRIERKLTGKNFAYAFALAEIIGNFALIRSGVRSGVIGEEPNKEEQNGIIPRMYYDDVMQISHSKYITTLVENGFKFNESVFNESEETLNSLKSEDNEILDLLILNWYAHGVRRFTDRQIAIALNHGGNTNEDVSKDELQRINESIERLRKTEIKQGVESVEDIGDKKLTYTQRPFLISVLPQDIKHEGSTTVYDFTGVQGFEEYALITKRTSKYSNALITADIKGIQHDFKNDNLKRLLVRRIKGLEYSKHTAIDMREVYEVLEITDPRKYTYVKKKVKTMLEELRNEDNDIYYNFSYEFKKRNKTTIITFTASTSNQLEVNKSKKE